MKYGENGEIRGNTMVNVEKRPRRTGPDYHGEVRCVVEVSSREDVKYGEVRENVKYV